MEVKNSEVHSEEKSRGQHDSEAQPEQSLSLQDWLNRESQSHATEYQSHMNEVRLEQLTGTKDNDLFGSKGYQTKDLMNQKLNDINSRMEEDDRQR